MEYDLSDEERTRLDSLIASVERRIAPACRWLLWADADVYQSYTSPLYRSRLPHFQGLWYPRWWRNKLIESAEYSQLALCAGRIKSKNRYREVETTVNLVFFCRFQLLLVVSVAFSDFVSAL